MKKIILAVAVLFAAINANAQLGVTAGLTSSSSDIQTAVADVNNINQYHVGVIYKMAFGDFLAIQPGLVYNMKGSNFADAATGKLQLDYKTGYLEVPVQVQAGFAVPGIARVYGFAEPFVGYAITNTTKDSITNDVKQTWDNIKNKLEYGVGVGAGVEFLDHFQVSVKYCWDLGEVYSGVNIGGMVQAVENSKCNSILASVAFLF